MILLSRPKGPPVNVQHAVIAVVWSRVWGQNGLARDSLFGPVRCLHAAGDRNLAEIKATRRSQP